MTRILLAEDDPALRDGVRDALAGEGYEVVTVADGVEAMLQFNSAPFDLAILDVSMPRKNGFEVCRDVRAAGIGVAILFLTVRADEVDRVLGLELGADDYVTKPFSLRELRARVAAILRRTGSPRAGSNKNKFTIGNCEIDLEGFVARRAGMEWKLPPKEAGMLKLMLANPGRVVSRERFLKEVWGSALFVGPRTVDTHMGRLRMKIEEDAELPVHLVTAHGIGYRLDL